LPSLIGEDFEPVAALIVEQKTACYWQARYKIVTAVADDYF
jgi:hypothetical protein